jgi:SRSO17 transposase
MDAKTIMKIKPTLSRFLSQFDDCFGRSSTRQYLPVYVRGQLSDLPRKSIEPIADAAGVPARNLQEFLGLYRWDEHRLRDQCQQYVAARHSHPYSVGVLDDTSYVKKGDQTACVQRQHCGAVGKIENCVVSVHLVYATPDFHTLIDGDLYLPEETWDADRDRCRKAGIPDDVVFRTKPQIALDQVRRAVSNGIRFAWLTFDEGYGRSVPFLRDLDQMGQNYVAEIPQDTMVRTVCPQVLYKAHHRDQGRGRQKRYPRLKVKNNPPAEVRHILKHSSRLRQQKWQTYHVKDGTKGPMVWEVKRLTVWQEDENGLPTRPYQLVIARNVLNPDEIKYFLSNAPESTPTEILLKVAFSRWTVERAFEDSKTELGMDHFEVRQYPSIQRHLILCCLSHLFLSEFCLTHRGEKSRPDSLPGTDGSSQTDLAVDCRTAVFPEICPGHQRRHRCHTAAKLKSRPVPSSPNHPEITCSRYLPQRHNSLSMELLVAL